MAESAAVLGRCRGDSAFPADDSTPTRAALTCAEGTASSHPLTRAKRLFPTYKLWGTHSDLKIQSLLQVMPFSEILPSHRNGSKVLNGSCANSKSKVQSLTDSVQIQLKTAQHELCSRQLILRGSGDKQMFVSLARQLS